MTIKDKHIYWAIFIIITALFMAYVQGYFDHSNKSDISGITTLSQSECKLVRGAINLVLDDMEHYTTFGEALEALLAEVPQKPRDVRPIVKAALGTMDIGALPKALVTLKDNLPHKEANNE